jgi:hypothetical protein
MHCFFFFTPKNVSAPERTFIVKGPQADSKLGGTLFSAERVDGLGRKRDRPRGRQHVHWVVGPAGFLNFFAPTRFFIFKTATRNSHFFLQPTHML